MLWQRLLPSLAALAPLFQAYSVRASLVDEIIYAIEHAVDCASCHSLLVSLKATALLGDGTFVATLTTVCKTLNLQDDDVCSGVFTGPGPILAHDLRSMSLYGQTSNKFCNALLGLCPEPSINNYTVTFPQPPPKDVKAFKSSGKPAFQVVHFSDVHIDREYSTGSEANCTKPLCCRNFTDQTNPALNPAGPLGNHACDTPGTLSQSLLQAVDSTPHDFSIFTGDIVDGAVWLVNQDEVVADIELFTSEFGNALTRPVFPALGNHEVSPVNSFPRDTSGKHAQDAQWVYDTSSAEWSQWIGRSAADQLRHYSGSYSTVVPGTSLRIISINTAFWYKLNFWLYDSNVLQPDPNGILEFLVSQLQLAEDEGQRVWIIGHMPPGGGDVFHDQSNYYDQVIQRYRHTIAGQFFGHTHGDEFQIAYSNYSQRSKDTATSVAWIAPALTPRSGNPAFKVYDVDPDTYEIMDAKVYGANLSHPEYQTGPTWELLYSARSTYGSLIPGGIEPSRSLSPSFWHQVTETFESNDTSFRMYQHLKRRTRGDGCSSHSAGDREKYENCKNETICALRAQRSENNCAVLRRGFRYRKRSAGEIQRDIPDSASTLISKLNEGAMHECEGVGVGHIFHQLAQLASNGLLDEDTMSVLSERLDTIILPAQAAQGLLNVDYGIQMVEGFE